MGRKSKYSNETKLKACRDYESGDNSFNSISLSIGTSREVVRRWYLAYKIHGTKAFETKKHNSTYSKEFKLSVIEEYLSGNFSSPDLGAKYNISNSMIRKWANMYYNGIEIKEYDPKGEVYTMKSRKTTFEERLVIVRWVITNDMNYKKAADQYGIRYALVYQWVQKYIKDGADTLKHKKRGPKLQNEIDKDSLSDIEKLRIELEHERVLRERAEFRLEVLKKKEEFERKLHSRK